MIFTKLIYLFLTVTGKKYDTYYKIIHYKNKLSCVEANTTEKFAKFFNAKKGNCKQENCSHYKGIHHISFCCDVHGYECNDE